MADVFISYSRKDIPFIRLLQHSLAEQSIDSWVDWENLNIGETWWNEINQAIVNANVFLVIISRNSVSSTVVKSEIEVALKNNKRIIPVVVDDFQPEVIYNLAPELATINWAIFSRDIHFRIEETSGDRQPALPINPEFMEALQSLNEAIRMDWKWVRFHTNLQIDALRWENYKRDPSYLLRGIQLEQIEKELVQAGSKNPATTLLQIEYILACRDEEKLIKDQKLHLEKRAIRLQFVLISTSIGLVSILILALILLNQRDFLSSESNKRATAEAVVMTYDVQLATAQSNLATLEPLKAYISTNGTTLPNHSQTVTPSPSIMVTSALSTISTSSPDPIHVILQENQEKIWNSVSTVIIGGIIAYFLGIAALLVSAWNFGSKIFARSWLNKVALQPLSGTSQIKFMGFIYWLQKAVVGLFR